MNRTPKMKGFSLLELITTLGIIAILAGLSYPAYSDYMRKSRRADATVTLMELQLAQEKQRASQPSYAKTLAELGQTTNADGIFQTPGGHYQLTMPDPSTSGLDKTMAYQITATPLTTHQKEDSCTAFVVTQQGADIRTDDASGLTADEKKKCWNK